MVALGELALDGTIRPAKGGLASAFAAQKLGLPCLLPAESAMEASIVRSCDTRVVTTLSQAVAVALGEIPGGTIPIQHSVDPVAPDLAHVRGQPLGRRALEIAAAGATIC